MSQYKVIIIGGGISGLSACVRLLEAGIRDILLIEANEYLGGRIRTIPFQNHVIELGAQWIHGTKGNPVYELAKSLNLTDETKDKDDKSFYYTTQDGQELDEDYVEKILNKLENIFDNLEDIIENELEDDDSDHSLGALINENFVKMLKKYKSKGQDNIEIIKSVYRSRVNEERFESACDDLRKLSAVGWNEYENFEGDHLQGLKYGYGKLIEYLSQQIPNHSVKLNEIVEQIDWTQTINRVSVFNKIENARKSYECSHVLCTFPLGYLKKKHHELFFPKLPLSKIKAIENLGFGCVDKIFLVFEYPILKENIEGLQILWREDLNFELEYSKKKWNLNNDKFYKALDTFEKLPKMSNVFVNFVCGEDARYIESLEEECLIDVVHELFRKCFPRLKLPRPSRILRSKWNQDPFTLGSYTYIKTGAKVSDVKSLAQSLSNQVYFAGEATYHKNLGTVHGAYQSGLNQANKIIKEIKN